MLQQFKAAGTGRVLTANHSEVALPVTRRIGLNHSEVLVARLISPNHSEVLLSRTRLG